MSQEQLDVVRRMWVLLREGGPEAALVTLAPAVVFVAADGKEVHGQDGVRGFFADFEARAERFVASPFTFEPVGGGVLVAGHRRIADEDHTIAAEDLHFAYVVRDGLIVDMRAFGSRATAVEHLEGLG